MFGNTIRLLLTDIRRLYAKVHRALVFVVREVLLGDYSSVLLDALGSEVTVGNCETRTRSVLRRPFRLRTHNRTGGHNWPTRFSSQLLRRPVVGCCGDRRALINFRRRLFDP